MGLGTDGGEVATKGLATVGCVRLAGGGGGGGGSGRMDPFLGLPRRGGGGGGGGGIMVPPLYDSRSDAFGCTCHCTVHNT